MAVAKNMDRAFNLEIDKFEQYRCAREIVKRNCQGKFWLIGGMVYRTLAYIIHDTPKPEVDINFIVEQPNSELVLPRDWELTNNSFGTFKFVGPNGNSIDFVPLEQVYSIKEREIDEPTIEDFLSGVPLNIQSIAYDVSEGSLVGSVGLGGIISRTIRVTDYDLAQYAARQKNLSLKSYVLEYARELGFGLVLV